MNSEGTPITSWLFRDFGRPLLGFQAGRLVVESVLAFRTDIAKVLTIGARSLPSKMSKDAVIEIHQRNLTQLISLLESERESTNLELDQRGFSIGNVEGFSNLELGALPWSKTTWSALETLGLGEQDLLVTLDAYSWGEILEVSDWGPLLEVLHMAHDWAPFAIRENLLVPQGNDLHDLADFLERFLIARMGAKADDNFSGFGILRERNAWGVERKTLDEVGLDRSLTKERIRQLEKKFEHQTLGLQLKPFKAIERLLELEYDPTFIDPIQTIEDLFNQSGNWDLLGIEKLIELASGSEELQRFRQFLAEASLSAEGLTEIVESIIKSRSILGVLRFADLHSKAESAGLDRIELRSLITRRYPRSIFAGEFVAARQVAKECMLFNFVFSQLAVSQPLHVDVLHTGVLRGAKGRSISKWVPPIRDFKTMLEQHESFVVDDSGYVSTEVETAFDSTVSGWIVRELQAKSGQMAAKSTLIRAAALEGHKFSTITQNLQYGAEFRLLKNSIVCLVGSKVNQDDVGHALRIAEVNDTRNQVVSYKIEDDSTFTAKLVFSTNFMVSGVLTVNSDLGVLLGKKARKSICCSLFVSDSSPKLSKGSLWANLSSLRDHLWNVHNYREGDVIEFLVTAEEVQPIIS